MRKPEVGQVWRVCDGGGLWYNVVLVGYHCHRSKPGKATASWTGRRLNDWKLVWMVEERWDPNHPKSRLTGPCSEDSEFYL